MLRISCPWCGERDQTEFSYGGQARRARPAHPEQLDDLQWAEYLFYRDNPRGPHRERWVHSWGCHQWFTVVRDTLTHEILQVFRMDEAQDADTAPENAESETRSPGESYP